MKTTSRILAALGATLILSVPLAAQSDFQWSGALAQGQTVHVSGVNGQVEASLSTDGRVRVDADRHARRSDPSEVRIEVVEHAGGVTICAVYPTPRRSRRENRCDADGGHNSVNENDVKVDFVVRVPAGVRFVGSTVNGGIEIDGLRSDVEARTVNGAVGIGTTGLAQASTVNGGITARLGSGTLTDDLEFSTVNGSIELELPADLAADLDARTTNGGIHSDFGVTTHGSQDRHRLRGSIGGGGPELELSTVNGRIILREL